MRLGNQVAVLLIVIQAVGIPSALAIHRATVNFDGSCEGYPEDLCSPLVVKSPSIGHAAPTCLAVNSSRSPFARQIRLVNIPELAYKEPLLLGHEIGPARLDVKIPKAWITSGAWNGDGELLLVDSGSGELLHLTASGRLLIVSLGGQGLKVSDIRPTETGILLKLRDGRFVALDRQGRFQKEWQPISPDGKSPGVRGIFNWVPLGNSLLAFGDVVTSASTWTSGWMQVPLREPASFTMVTSAALDSVQRRIYVLGNSYAASDGSTGYLLIPGSPRPQLLRISQESGGFEKRALEGFEDTSLRDESRLLPMGGTREDFIARYRALEHSVAPVGLYAQGGKLYLLIRRPALTAGQTEWELARLNKESGRILGRITLPTRANHLIVIPGKERWAFVEKGSVQALGQQDVEGVLLIPTSWIAEGKSGDKSLSVAAVQRRGMEALRSPRKNGLPSAR